MPLELSETQGFDATALLGMIDKATEAVNTQLEKIQANSSDINIGDMFTMQMLMNELAQTSEAMSSVVNASNGAIQSMARNIK